MAFFGNKFIKVTEKWVPVVKSVSNYDAKYHRNGKEKLLYSVFDVLVQIVLCFKQLQTTICFKTSKTNYSDIFYT